MVYAIAAKSGERPRWHQLEHAIRRNFGGLTERTPVDIFKGYFPDADVSTGFFFFLKGLIGRQVIFSLAAYNSVLSQPYVFDISFLIRMMKT